MDAWMEATLKASWARATRGFCFLKGMVEQAPLRLTIVIEPRLTAVGEEDCKSNYFGEIIFHVLPFEREQVGEDDRLLRESSAKASSPWTCPLKNKNSKEQNREKKKGLVYAIAMTWLTACSREFIG